MSDRIIIPNDYVIDIISDSQKEFLLLMISLLDVKDHCQLILVQKHYDQGPTLCRNLSCHTRKLRTLDTVPENGTDHKIYEVVEKHSQFQLNVVSGKPTSTNRHKKSILVDDISANDVKELEKVIYSADVKKSVVHWKCQDYVLGILDKLAEECIVNEDEEEYKNIRKKLKKHTTQ